MRLIFRLPLIAFCFFLLTAFGSGERLFAPSADLWERWQAHDPESTRTIDHSGWSVWLERYVRTDPAGPDLVAYGSVSPQDRAKLSTYVAMLSGVAVSTLNRDEQLAYWINLYNALTVDVVLTHYPVDSIRDIDISPGFFSDGPWGKELVRVEDTDLSLNDIEHRILRPVWRDPRIHYAVNCASIGCPDLRNTAYTSADIDRQLSEAARNYVNDPRGVLVRGTSITLSKIYDWFFDDFGGSEDALMTHLLLYARPELAQSLRRIGGFADVRYDWSINAVE